jgi:hypothetical protein
LRSSTGARCAVDAQPAKVASTSSTAAETIVDLRVPGARRGAGVNKEGSIKLGLSGEGFN